MKITKFMTLATGAAVALVGSAGVAAAQKWDMPMAYSAN